MKRAGSKIAINLLLSSLIACILVLGALPQEQANASSLLAPCIDPITKKTIPCTPVPTEKPTDKPRKDPTRTPKPTVLGDNFDSYSDIHLYLHSNNTYPDAASEEFCDQPTSRGHLGGWRRSHPGNSGLPRKPSSFDWLQTDCCPCLCSQQRVRLDKRYRSTHRYWRWSHGKGATPAYSQYIEHDHS